MGVTRKNPAPESVPGPAMHVVPAGAAAAIGRIVQQNRQQELANRARLQQFVDQTVLAMGLPDAPESHRWSYDLDRHVVTLVPVPRQ